MSKKNNAPKAQSAPPTDAQKAQATDRADRINEGLEFAQTVLPVGSQKLAAKLDTLRRSFPGSKIYAEKGENNPYYTIDDDYVNGDLISLFKHIHFKQIPDNMPDVSSYYDLLMDDPHVEAQHYQDYQKKWRSGAYGTLTENIEKAAPDTLYGPIDFMNRDILEQVMNSSAAWQIAKRNAFDSNQVKERWTELYGAMNSALDTDKKIFDWATRQVMNQKMTLNQILNAVDDEVWRALQGKSSRRIK